MGIMGFLCMDTDARDVGHENSFAIAARAKDTDGGERRIRGLRTSDRHSKCLLIHLN